MEGIKNLVFDFGGVIINLTRNRCIEAFARLGVDVREELGSIYFPKDIFMQLEMGELTASDFRDCIRLLTSQRLTDNQIDEAWIAMLAEVPSNKLNLLLDLRQKYNTMLLSNTNVIHWEWSLENVFSDGNHNINDFFDKVYLSYELHKLKPNPDIFEYILSDSGILPHETLFIDDALVNCKTAETLGFYTYTPEPREDWSHLFNYKL